VTANGVVSDEGGVSVRDCLRVLREQWIVIGFVVLLAAAGAGATWWLRPPEYTAQLTFYVSAQAVDTTNAAYQGSLLSQQRVSSYVELVTNPRVSQEVVRRLGLAASPEAVAERITATSAADSVLIDVLVVDRSPQQAADVANAVGTAFPELVAELERPSVPDGVPPVAVRVVQPASVPTAPSSISLPVTLALGVLAGAAAGAGIGLARKAVDTTIRLPEDLRAATEAPNLGTIGYDPEVPRRPLTVHVDPRSPRAEAFRQLRTNLQFVDVDQPHKVILVTSSLPGEGKTTSLCNLAIATAAADARVLVVEADLRRPRVVELFGLDGSAGLTNILTGRAGFEDVVQPWAGGPLDVLASGPLPPNPSELLASRQMGTLLSELRGRYDLVLVDSPPLLPVTDAAAVAPATDGALLVCRFKHTTREQVGRAVEALAAVSAPVLGSVLTMVPSSGPWAYAEYDAYYPAADPAVASGSGSDAECLPAGPATSR
jgi:succinoglycan biosynthesis transport protein ExoP